MIFTECPEEANECILNGINIRRTQTSRSGKIHPPMSDKAMLQLLRLWTQSKRVHQESKVRKVRPRTRNKKVRKRDNTMHAIQRLTHGLAPQIPSTASRKRMTRNPKGRAITAVHIVITTQLSILQYNLHKSKERTHSILNDPDTKRYAILMLQEQYWSAYTKSAPKHHAWTLIEPTNSTPRTATYINRDFFTASQIAPIALPLSDVTALVLNTPDAKPTLIVNVYNPCDKDIITELHAHLQKDAQLQEYGIILIGGDFNTHHPMWNPRGYTRHDSNADALIDMMTDLGLSLLLPAGTVTYPNAGTTIDLIWGNDEAANRVITCKIAEGNDHGSDHLPIETTLAMQIEHHQPPLPFNYAKTNWKELKRRLKHYLPSTTGSAKVDEFARDIVNAITKAVEETMPRKRPSPHSKRWWNKELTNMRREANQLRNTFRRTRHKTDTQLWRTKANEYTQKIAQAKTSKWKEYVDKAEGKTIWQVKKYITNVPTSMFVPTLDRQAATNEEKVDTLHKSFFPNPPAADLRDIPGTTYPSEVPYDKKVSIRQIREAVNKLSPDKAPGPDGVSNRVLKNTLSIIEGHLQILMQASIDTGHFPKVFKHTTTIVLRKPGKPDYSKAKAYRPIALENTLGKVIIADTLSYLTETHYLLPAHHYGGGPGRSAEDAMIREHTQSLERAKGIHCCVHGHSGCV